MALLLCSGLFVVLVVAISIFGYVRYARQAPFLSRLQAASNFGLAAEPPGPTGPGAWLSLLVRLGDLMPPGPVEAAMQKRELAMAGFRSDAAGPAFSGLKIFSTASFLIAGLALRTLPENPALKILLPVIFAVLGFKLPGIVLARLIKSRQQRIRLSLPDALDMMVVCCEAGCALDQAILNVSREFKHVHPAVSDELSLVNMELLAGSSRVTALRNLATRTGEDELKKLVAILIQTDRFGTSVAEALRTQADFMRIKRRQMAEEKAAKVGVKLVFPIFFFCMPALGILVVGPGLLQLMKNFFPALNAIN